MGAGGGGGGGGGGGPRRGGGGFDIICENNKNYQITNEN